MRNFFKSVLVMLATANAAAAVEVEYAIDDGSAERTVTIDPAEDTIWLNTFPVEPGGELVTSVSAAFGRPGLGAPMDGFAINILVYEDLDGGSPANATLVSSAAGTVVDAHSNILTTYSIPPAVVHGTLVIGVHYANRTAVNQPIAALDQTSPTFAGRSWAGFTIGDMNFAQLSSIPANQFKPVEQFNVAGNFLLRATATAVPEPASVGLMIFLVSLARRRR
jgi:hypothetical protein